MNIIYFTFDESDKLTLLYWRESASNDSLTTDGKPLQMLETVRVLEERRYSLAIHDKA